MGMNEDLYDPRPMGEIMDDLECRAIEGIERARKLPHPLHDYWVRAWEERLRSTRATRARMQHQADALLAEWELAARMAARRD